MISDFRLGTDSTSAQPRIVRSRWPRARQTSLAALVALVAITVSASGPRSAAPVVAAASKPNFVLILVDDLDQMTSPYWQALPQTKALIADRGVTFANSFAPTPICCPARASILTGELGHNTGVLTNAGNQGGWGTFKRNNGERRTFVKTLQEQGGYYTGFAGKYLNGYGESRFNPDPTPNTTPPQGWSDWHAAWNNKIYSGYKYKLNDNGVINSYGGDPGDYATDVIRDKGLRFLSDADVRNDAQPFFLMLAPTAPHSNIPPAPRHTDHAFAQAEPITRPNYLEKDITDKPPWLQRTGDERAIEAARISTPEWRRRLGSLFAVDEMVAAVVKRLQDLGELNNTYLVFASDNGFNLGAHRLGEKMVPYEESIRVPLSIAGPGIKRGTSSLFALQTDYAATFLD